MVCHPCISPWTHDAAPDFRLRKVITDLGDVQFSLSVLANTSPMLSPLLTEFHIEQFLSSKEVILTASPGEKDDTWARSFMRNFGPFLLGIWNTLKVRGNTVVMESLKSTKTVINKYETYIAIFCVSVMIYLPRTHNSIWKSPVGEWGMCCWNFALPWYKSCCPATLAAQPKFSYVIDRFAFTESQRRNPLIWNFIHQQAKKKPSMACELRSNNEPTSLENHVVVKDFLLFQTEMV